MLRKLFVLPVLGLLLLPAVSKAAPQFSDVGVGMVQVRWGHINREFSPLTQAQSILLDGHFVIEHSARNRSGCFFNFNGTANVGLGYFLSNVLEIGIRQGASYSDTSAKQWAADTRAFVDLYWDLGQWQPFIGASGGWRYGDAVPRNTGIYGPEAGIKYFLTTSAYAFFAVGYDRQCHQDRLPSGKLIDGLFIYSLGLGCKL